MSVPFRPFSKRIYHSYVKYHLRFLCISRHFRIKGTITLSCPQRKRGQNPKGTLSCPVHSLSVYTKDQYIAPNPLSAHKRRKERDNNMSLLRTYSVKGTIILSPYTLFFHWKEHNIVPFSVSFFRLFPTRPHKKRDNILSLLYADHIKTA